MAGDIVLETHCGLKYQLLADERFELFDEFKIIVEAVIGSIFYGGLWIVGERFFKRNHNVYSLNIKVSEDILDRFINPPADLEFESMINKLVAEKCDKEFPVKELMKYVCEIFIESTYSVGAMLAGGLQHLAVNPEYMRKAVEEQKAIFGDSLASPTMEDLNRMEYLERVVKEVFRITSPAIVAKRSSGVIKTDRAVIPNNATLIYFWDGLRRNQKYWKNGDKFDPDHWLPEEVAKRPKYAIHSFSSGPRACPGFQYTNICCKLIISNVLRSFKITSPLKPEDLVYTPSIFTNLIGPHTVSLEPRFGMDRLMV